MPERIARFWQKKGTQVLPYRPLRADRSGFSREAPAALSPRGGRARLEFAKLGGRGPEDAPKSDANQPLAFLNVGTGVDLTIRALAEQIADVVGFNGNLLWDPSKPDGTPKKQLDVSRLRAMGWSASISLTEGLQRAYADFKEALATEQLRG